MGESSRFALFYLPHLLAFFNLNCIVQIETLAKTQPYPMKKSWQISFDWWKDTFGQKYLEGYSSRITAKDTIQTVDFLINSRIVRPPMSVLDLACGYGRHLIELSSRGDFRDLCGIDQSALFIKMAVARSQSLPSPPDFFRVDMRNLRGFKGRFDIILNLFTSFGYFATMTEEHATLKGISLALRHGGRFLIDLNDCTSTILSMSSKKDAKIENGLLTCSSKETLPCGLKVSGRHWLDVKAMRRFSIVGWSKNGRRRSYKSAIKLYSLPHLTELLEQHGLVVESAWGDFDQSPYQFNSRRMIVLAHKIH